LKYPKLSVNFSNQNRKDKTLVLIKKILSFEKPSTDLMPYVQSSPGVKQALIIREPIWLFFQKNRSTGQLTIVSFFYQTLMHSVGLPDGIFSKQKYQFG
jgi:hypothetical protein